MCTPCVYLDPEAREEQHGILAMDCSKPSHVDHALLHLRTRLFVWGRQIGENLLTFEIKLRIL